jgi:carbonic anhydrase
VQPIPPAASAVISQPTDQQLDAAIQENVRLQVAAVPQNSAVIAAALTDGRALVVGAVYDLDSGKVVFQ